MPEFTRRLRSAWDAIRGLEGPYRPGESKAASRRGSARSLDTIPTAGYNAYGGWGDYSSLIMLGGPPGDVDPVANIPLHQNVVVTAGINWLARNLPVPDLTVVHDDNEDGEEDAEIEDHWFVDLLDRPNETRDFFSFFHQCVLSDVTDGNTFLLKRKDGSGRVVDLWWLPPWDVWPVPDGSRKKALDRYEYRSGRDVTVYRPDEIVHIVNVPPTDGSLRGSTPLVAASRSVKVINRIELYDDSLLLNFGAASHMISPRDPAAVIQKEDLDAIGSWWARKHAGRNVGKPLVAPRGLRADKIGFSPDEMAIERMPHRHVAHILSVMGLSPMVLGLPDESKTYANLSESNRAAYENALMPMLARFCEGFNHDPDLIAAGERLKPDYSHVPCLQDDRAVKIHSLVEAKGAGILDEDECRAEIHYPPRTDAQKEAAKPPPPVVLPPQAGLGAGQEPGDETGEGDGAEPAAPPVNGKSAHPRFSVPPPDPDAALRHRASAVLAAIEAKLGGGPGSPPGDDHWRTQPRDGEGHFTRGGGSAGPVTAVVGPPRFQEGGEEAKAFNLDVAANQFRARGVAVEPNGSDMLIERQGFFGSLGVVASTDVERDGKVYLNDHSSHWDDPAGRIKRDYQEGLVSSGNPEHVIDHETAHALQYREIGGKEQLRLEKLKWAPADEKVARSVSRYAGKSPLEFTAEVYAGSRGGKKYGVPVMELYGRLKGPKL